MRRTMMQVAWVAVLALALAIPVTLMLGEDGVLNAAPTASVNQQTSDSEEDESEADEEAEDVDAEDVDAEEMELVTATAFADLVRPGRVLMSARGNHWVYDSVPPINGPNEEVNPLDGVLSAVISCGMYLYEAVGIEEDIEIEHLSSTVMGELDPRGLAGTANVNPRIRAFHITMNVDGPTAEEAAMMAETFTQHCPIHTTLSRSAPITITNVVNGEEQEPLVTEALEHEDDAVEEDELQLAQPMASGVMVQFGRSLMSARGNHWILDSVPPINGPNEEVNPMDALLGALPACGIMIYEAAALENDIPLHAVNATVEGDLDPRGLTDASVSPRIRAFRVTVNFSGPTMEEAEMLADEFRARCPIYTTFERSAPIEITNVDMDAEAELPAGPTLVLRQDHEIESAGSVDVVQMLLAFEPGAWTPPHYHGGDTLVTVVDGELVNHHIQMGGDRVDHPAGSGWYESAGVVHAAGNDTDEMSHALVSFALPPDAAITTGVENDTGEDLPPGPELLLRGDLALEDVPEDATMVHVVLDFPAGVWTPEHYHGGDALVTVLEGEMTRRVGDEEETIATGDSWIEPAGEPHAAGNATDEHARVGVTFILPEGEALTTNVE